MGVGGQSHTPAALHPGKTRYPLYRWLGGPQGQSGRVRKILPPPGFDPGTFQPVASRYTDWAIPAPFYFVFLYCFVYCASFRPLFLSFVQVHRPLLPGGNPTAVNK